MSMNDYAPDFEITIQGKKKEPFESRFINHDVFFVTENADGMKYCVDIDSIDLYDDWMGDCLIVPANDAPVYFAMVDGNPVSMRKPLTFETFVEFFCGFSMERALELYPPEASEDDKEKDFTNCEKDISDPNFREKANRRSSRKIAVKREQRKLKRLENQKGWTCFDKNGHIRSYKDKDGKDLKRYTNIHIRRNMKEDLPRKGNGYRKSIDSWKYGM